ncbi:MAG TPA: ABC transporter ATP-binding protein, partial [Streptosporangiaceae bacterium]
MMPPEDVLQVRGLHAGHGGLAVVRDVDLSIQRGQVVALLGPNGAGKTTILRTIAGLLPAISGEIVVVGRAPSVRRPYLAARRGLAYVPDSRCLFRSLTVRQNLVLAARRSRSDVDSVFEYLPALKPLSKRDAGLLSGGEQQMLVIGRALLSEPKIVLIDELSLGLAPKMVLTLLETIQRFNAERGTACLLVEQAATAALKIATSAYLLQRGTVVYHGSAARLRDDVDVL